MKTLPRCSDASMETRAGALILPESLVCQVGLGQVRPQSLPCLLILDVLHAIHLAGYQGVPLWLWLRYHVHDASPCLKVLEDL